MPSPVCITRDNTQLQVDGILYFQVTDPKLASYGSSNYVSAITQLAQTTLRSIIGKMELDKTFEERDLINAQVVAALDDAARSWGVKVLRYEIKDLTPPAAILLSMQAQITAEREKRAVIATSEGKVARSRSTWRSAHARPRSRRWKAKQADINNAQGGQATLLNAEANAKAIRDRGGNPVAGRPASGESQGGRRLTSMRSACSRAPTTTVDHPVERRGHRRTHRDRDERGQGREVTRLVREHRRSRSAIGKQRVIPSGGIQWRTMKDAGTAFAGK